MENLKVAYQFGPFTLAPSERLLRRNGQSIDIEPKEFKVLMLFLEQPGHLFSKNELMHRGWGTIVLEATMANVISNLRRVLGDDRKAPLYIKTESRVGYRFICPVKLADPDREAASVKGWGPVEGLTAASFEISAQLKEKARLYERTAADLRAAASLLERGTPQPTSHEGSNMINQEQRATFFFELAQKASRSLIGPEQSAWLDALESAQSNLLATLEYYGERESTAPRELELAVSLGHYWNIRGSWSQGREMLRRALARQPERSSVERARALAWAGYLTYRQDDYEQAERLLTESVSLSQVFGDDATVSFALNCLGWAAEAQGKYEEAKTLFKDNLKVGQRLDSDWLMGIAFAGLGTVDEYGAGDHESMKNYYRMYFSYSRRLQVPREIAAAIDRLGVAAQQEGNHFEARARYEKSLALMGAIRHRNGIANCYLNLGRLEAAAGRHQAGYNFFKKGLALYKELGNRFKIAASLEAMGGMADALGKGEEAGRLFGAAEGIRISIAAPLSPAEQKRDGRIRAAVKQQFTTEWNEGSRLSSDEV
ncbi:MAG TPA: tetratricopeptide repeat protein [Blastocatellia bacterium]|nr:tetratricopeptide repeat protein [Blastocatellia bacterium]